MERNIFINLHSPKNNCLLPDMEAIPPFHTQQNYIWNEKKSLFLFSYLSSFWY